MYSNKNSDIVRIHTCVENGDLVLIQTLLYDKPESNTYSKRQGSAWHMGETSTQDNDTLLPVKFTSLKQTALSPPVDLLTGVRQPK